MNKYFKGKTWIHWVKFLLAIDITSVGISLIFQTPRHILANIFGPFSRIIFGVLYILFAMYILKLLFPLLFNDALNSRAILTKKLTKGFRQDNEDVTVKKSVGEIVNKTAKKIDVFVKRRSNEVKDEVKKVFNDEL